jgi:hypothetical protein
MWGRQEGFVLSAFVAAQVLDGGLTYAGVQRLGMAVEMNGLLVFYMETFGLGLTLLGAKGVACVCGMILHVTRKHRPLAVATGAYVGLAIVPWLIALAH